MIYEHVRATEDPEAVQGLSDLFRKRLQNDDVQDFDVRWDQALLSVSEMPSDMILEGSNLQDSVQRQTVLALHDQETVRNNGETSYLRWKTSARRHIDQTMRTRTFRPRNEIVERGAVTKSQQRGEKSAWMGRWENAISERHMDNVRKDTHAVSVMTNKHKETCTVVRDEKDDGLLPHQIRRPRLTKWKALQTEGARFRAVTKFFKKKKPSCKI